MEGSFRDGSYLEVGISPNQVAYASRVFEINEAGLGFLRGTQQQRMIEDFIRAFSLRFQLSDEIYSELLNALNLDSHHEVSGERFSQNIRNNLNKVVREGQVPTPLHPHLLIQTQALSKGDPSAFSETLKLLIQELEKTHPLKSSPVLPLSKAVKKKILEATQQILKTHSLPEDIFEVARLSRSLDSTRNQHLLSLLVSQWNKEPGSPRSMALLAEIKDLVSRNGWYEANSEDYNLLTSRQREAHDLVLQNLTWWKNSPHVQDLKAVLEETHFLPPQTASGLVEQLKTQLDRQTQPSLKSDILKVIAANRDKYVAHTAGQATQQGSSAHASEAK